MPDDGNLPPAEQPTDWARDARSAVAKTDTAGYRKLGRGRLTRLCQHLSDGIPLETAAPLVGTKPNTVRDWCEKNPAVEEIVTRARAVGEQTYLKRIAASADWKAAQFMVGAMNSSYRDDRAQGPAGASLNVVINVPIPQSFAAGARATIDIKPQRTQLDVDSTPAQIMDGEAK